jgi:hypothetical protein
MSFGIQSYGSDLYGGENPLFQVVSADAVNSRTLIVSFTESPDLLDPETFNPSNYYISAVSGGSDLGSPLQVLAGDSINTLRLVTPVQLYLLYRVVVSSFVRSQSGAEIDSEADRSDFTGFPGLTKVFRATASRPDGIVLTFDSTMLVDVNLRNPLKYIVQEVSGAQVSVSSVTPNLTSNATSLTLNLSSTLRANTPHLISIDQSVHTAAGLSLLPADDVFVWVPRVLSTKVSFSAFSQEVKASQSTGGLDQGIADLFGDPNGLVFFSPSLKTGGAPTSSIQVDRVSTCTNSSDTYSFPRPVDPKPAFIHGSNLVPTVEASVLNSNVFFTNFYRLNEAKHVLRDIRSELMPALVDLEASMVLTEVWPPARVSLLNSPGWVIFDGASPPPYPGVFADNMSPFPPPVVGNTNYFVNPSEKMLPLEMLHSEVGMSISPSDTVGITEVFDLIPGDNAVQVNVVDSLGSSESVSTAIGFTLEETLTISESLAVTP